MVFLSFERDNTSAPIGKRGADDIPADIIGLPGLNRATLSHDLITECYQSEIVSRGVVYDGLSTRVALLAGNDR